MTIRETDEIFVRITSDSIENNTNEAFSYKQTVEEILESKKNENTQIMIAGFIVLSIFILFSILGVFYSQYIDNNYY